MNGDLISRSALIADINNQRRLSKTSFPKRSFVVGDTISCIYDSPAVDAVPMEVYKQVMWERDCAMQQLKEHGVPFGGKTGIEKAIKLLHEKYEHAKKWDWVRKPLAYALYEVWKIVDEKEKPRK